MSGFWSRIEARWLALAPNVRGALWMLASCFMFSTMGLFVKLLGEHLPSHQAAFFRALFGLAAVLPFVLGMGRAGFATKRLPLHLTRGLTGAAAMLCGFYSMAHLPLADSVALSFTKPLWLIPLAVLFLGEIVRVRRWVATGAGFLGVVVMMRPGQGPIDPAVYVALTGAFFVALVTVQVKKLISTEHPATLIFYSTCIASLVTAVPAFVVWQTPEPRELLLLLIAGLLGTIGQSLGIRALQAGDSTAVAPIDYVRLLISGFYGYWFFGDVPDVWTRVGAAIIVGSTLYIAHREAQLGKAPAPPSGPPH